MKPNKFRFIIGVKDGKILEQMVYGYDTNVDLPNLKTYSVKIHDGWLVADQKTGVCVAGMTPVQTEKEAVDNFLGNINSFGEQSILKGIADFLKNLQEGIEKYNSEKEKTNGQESVN